MSNSQKQNLVRPYLITPSCIFLIQFLSIPVLLTLLQSHWPSFPGPEHRWHLLPQFPQTVDSVSNLSPQISIWLAFETLHKCFPVTRPPLSNIFKTETCTITGPLKPIALLYMFFPPIAFFSYDLLIICF